MLLSMNWIKDFVDLEGLDLDELIHRFTLSTAEVEDIIHKGEDIKDVVVAKILSVENHPESKKLHLLKVDTGDKVWDVVCGAPNVREGMLTAFAKEGGMAGGMTMAARKVGGYMSYGMCCSEVELGISADNSGIMDLPEDLVPGTDIKDIYPIDDVIFEVDNKSLTNRPDLWGHYGIAREFAALADRPLKPHVLHDTKQYDNLEEVSIDIKDTENAYRYSSIKVENITVNRSPMEMRIRLFYCGSRAINFLADLTNYIMLELGQPMHAFDKRRVDKVEVQRFPEEFKFTTLDEVERNIDPSMLMITSNDKPVAIAGVMGGLDSSIFDDTQTLLLESATFNGVSIRKTSTKLGLRTDASARYEKMLDPEITVIAIERFLELMFAVDPNAKVVSRLSDNYPTKYDTIKLDFDKRYVDRYTGIDITNDRIVKTLTSLGFDVTNDGDNFSVVVPSWRATKDVTIPADIIEEITRIYGYDNFKIETTKAALYPVEESAGRNNDNQAKDILVKKFKLHEVHSYIWCDSKKFENLGMDVEDNVRVINAMTVEHTVLRNSMIPTLVCMAHENRGYAPSYGLFEIGRVVKGKRENGEANERKTLGILLFSQVESEKDLFFKLRDIFAHLCSDIKHKSFTFENIAPNHNWQHPKNTVAIMLDGKKVGEMAASHPTVAGKVAKKACVVFGEIDMDDFAETKKDALNYNEPSKYPSMDIDLSFVIGADTKYSDLACAWEGAGYDYLTGASVVDTYDDGTVKSISVRLYFSSNEKTLARTDIQPTVDDIIAKLADKGINLKA
ncbi:MAG: phenylalanine--tRNA ligase subunit beta [Clostridia bacterium]|nr:phenylalanine--tRNA ligase subunit beta [Clostridia bacterium]